MTLNELERLMHDRPDDFRVALSYPREDGVDVVAAMVIYKDRTSLGVSPEGKVIAFLGQGRTLEIS